MSEINFISLESTTQDFFKNHWSTDSLGTAPKWEAWEPFLYGSVPKYNEGGCYALFVNDELVYIGLGASRGSGIYLKSGISRRLMSHVYCSAQSSDPRQLKLQEPWHGLHVNGLYTIGLSDKDYLATALESYLIRQLSPRRNKRV